MNRDASRDLDIIGLLPKRLDEMKKSIAEASVAFGEFPDACLTRRNPLGLHGILLVFDSAGVCNICEQFCPVMWSIRQRHSRVSFDDIVKQKDWKFCCVGCYIDRTGGGMGLMKELGADCDMLDMSQRNKLTLQRFSSVFEVILQSAYYQRKTPEKHAIPYSLWRCSHHRLRTFRYWKRRNKRIDRVLREHASERLAELVFRVIDATIPVDPDFRFRENMDIPPHYREWFAGNFKPR